MKHFMSIVTISTIYCFSFFCERIDEIEVARQELKQTLDRFYAAQEQKDLVKISSTYLQDSIAIALGPNINDRFMGGDQIQHLWQGFLGDAHEIKVWRRDEISQINFEGNTAWISSVNRMESKQDDRWETIRYFFTGVLKKKAGNWFFVQTHISIPLDSTLKITQTTVPDSQSILEIQKEPLENKKILSPQAPVVKDSLP